MSSLRILHLADLHLGWKPQFLGPLAEERQRERDELLRRAVDFVLEREPVDLVIIAGDLFETHKPPSALVEAVIVELQRLVDAGVAVVTVPGNHDEITYADSVYRVHGERWPGVLIQNPMPAHVETLDINGTSVHVYGLAYTGGLTRTRPPIADFPRLDEDGVHIAVFHGSLDWDAGDRSLSLTSRALGAAGYHYVALGHIHRPGEHKLGASGLAVYPGMVEGKGFSDPGVGEFTVASIHTDNENAGRAVIEKFPAHTRRIRWLELDVTPLDDMEAVAQRIRAEAADGRDIVQVRLVGAAPGFIDVDALTAQVASEFYFLEVVDETSMLDDDVVERLALEPTVRGEFVRRMRARMVDAADDAQRELAARALRRGLAALGGSSS